MNAIIVINSFRSNRGLFFILGGDEDSDRDDDFNSSSDGGVNEDREQQEGELCI